MTTQTEALKLALEALENNKQTHYYCEDNWYSCPQHEDGCANDSVGDECNCGADKANAKIDKAITAIKEALAQPEQKPVAWVCRHKLDLVNGKSSLLCTTDKNLADAWLSDFKDGYAWLVPVCDQAPSISAEHIKDK